jgi:adenine phosphoribosyltransferase
VTEFYTISIGGVERHLPICRVNDEISFAAFVMLGDVEITTVSAKELLARTSDFDVILTAEAKGIPLAYEMARQSQKSYIVARKSVKLYMQSPHVTTVQSISTAEEQTLVLDDSETERLRGRRVLIVDDVISTGESLRALEHLVKSIGGIVVDRMAVLAEGAAAERTDIKFLDTIPIIKNL